MTKDPNKILSKEELLSAMKLFLAVSNIDKVNLYHLQFVKFTLNLQVMMSDPDVAIENALELANENWGSRPVYTSDPRLEEYTDLAIFASEIEAVGRKDPEDKCYCYVDISCRVFCENWADVFYKQNLLASAFQVIDPWDVRGMKSEFHPFYWKYD